mmetsp:Transcript_13523/g.27512  ORF Transcript_13523/g.27512 Transcript_13523/m.27512 type:complete len:211 (-) Transcript_13523:448-1080(-)
MPAQGRRSGGPILLWRQADPESRGHRECERVRHQVPGSFLGEPMRPVQVPGRLPHVRVVRVVQVHQGLRGRLAAAHALDHHETEKRRPVLRLADGHGAVQHRKLRPRLHFGVLDSILLLLHGLQPWRHAGLQRACEKGRRPHPRRGQVPRPRQPRPLREASLQRAGVHRRRDLRCEAGPHHRHRRQRLPSGGGFQDRAGFRGELFGALFA